MQGERCVSDAMKTIELKRTQPLGVFDSKTTRYFANGKRVSGEKYRDLVATAKTLDSMITERRGKLYVHHSVARF